MNAFVCMNAYDKNNGHVTTFFEHKDTFKFFSTLSNISKKGKKKMFLNNLLISIK